MIATPKLDVLVEAQLERSTSKRRLRGADYPPCGLPLLLPLDTAYFRCRTPARLAARSARAITDVEVTSDHALPLSYSGPDRLNHPTWHAPSTIHFGSVPLGQDFALSTMLHAVPACFQTVTMVFAVDHPGSCRSNTIAANPSKHAKFRREIFADPPWED